MAGNKIDFSPDSYLEKLSQENKPELQFQAESREEWYLWRQKLKLKIAELLGGLPQSFRVTELKILEKSEFKTYSRIRIAYQVEGYLKIPAYLLIPDQNAEHSVSAAAAIEFLNNLKQ
jgi:hypothetical protein